MLQVYRSFFLGLACLVGISSASTLGLHVSPVQKVIELMGECKAKIHADVAEEQAAMESYMGYCHDEVTARSYAIKASAKDIEALEATVAEQEAMGAEASEQIASLGEAIAATEQELAGARQEREAQHADFQAADGELVKAVEETAAAVKELEAAMPPSLAQVGAGAPPRATSQVPLATVKAVLQRVLEGTSILLHAPREHLESLLQSASGAGEAEELTTNFKAALRQAPPPPTYESQSGGILETVKDMQDKAEAQLSDLRKAETKNRNDFTLMEDSLSQEIAAKNKKLAAAQALQASSSEKLSTAQGSLGQAQRTKADDEEYSATLRAECQKKAKEFEERSQSVQGELAAIDKATDILSKGVVALVQTTVTRTSSDDDSRRLRAATEFRNLGRKFHRIGFMELAAAASSDPFVKIRGLVEDMIAKLMREAAEEASHKAFCDTELGKSNTAKAEKTASMEKHQTRMDAASSEIAALGEAVKRLGAEIAEIDQAQAEATALRTQENAENTKAMADLQQSADAVIAAISTLKSFYEGTSLAQVGRQLRRSRQPEFGAAKSDSANGIIGILEVAESDFTKLYAETEAAETDAAAAYKKLTQENKISRAQKDIDVKAKTSEIKSLEVTLSRNSEDHAAVAGELDAVEAYLAKLKPECETKVMSYGERKAAREAEIEGLKEALGILTGN